MKKYTVIVLLTAVLFLSACGGTKDIPTDVNLAELGEKLLTQGGFSDELALIEPEMAIILYGTDMAAEQYVYIGSGATPEEIGLFAFADAEDAAYGLTLVRQRIEDQKKEFLEYNAWEMPKLEAALAEQYGNYVVLCISPDDTAHRMIEDAFD